MIFWHRLPLLFLLALGLLGSTTSHICDNIAPHRRLYCADMEAAGDRSRSPSPVRSMPTYDVGGSPSPQQEGSAREYLIPPGTRRSSYFQSDDEEDPETFETKPVSLPLSMRPVFAWIGDVVASSPRLTILICICFTSLCTLGLLSIYVDTDPFTLWAPPHCRSARDKLSYDEAFGPFYRIEQLILSTAPENDTPTPILAKESIEFVRLFSFLYCFLSGSCGVHRLLASAY